jgi:hypothetical protein
MTKFTIANLERIDHISCLKTELVSRPLRWQLAGLSYTATGYGARIPTEHMIHFEGIVRRIYCTTYSNSGTCWFNYKGMRITVSAH